jgi:hypothetical protein
MVTNSRDLSAAGFPNIPTVWDSDLESMGNWALKTICYGLTESAGNGILAKGYLIMNVIVKLCDV